MIDLDTLAYNYGKRRMKEATRILAGELTKINIELQDKIDTQQESEACINKAKVN